MNQAELIGKIIEISHSNLELTARINAILVRRPLRLRGADRR